jgi:hypothetical protein
LLDVQQIDHGLAEHLDGGGLVLVVHGETENVLVKPLCGGEIFHEQCDGTDVLCLVIPLRQRDSFDRLPETPTSESVS